MIEFAPEIRHVKIHTEIGNWPAAVFLYADQIESFVSIHADHNTQDWDTKLDRNQVTELRDALTLWLEETDG